MGQPNEKSGNKSAAKDGSSQQNPQARLLSWQRAAPSLSKSTEGRVFAASKDPKDYAATDLQSMRWVRLPGQINDQRINIDKCNASQFFLLDQCDSVQIDECKQCIFFIGPCIGSIFARNCEDCVFVAVCGQLRTRDCKRCTFSLYCQARPVIESSSELRFCSLSARHQYFLLETHMHKAKLSVFNNLYWYVHDFTPSGRPNSMLISQSEFEFRYDASLQQQAQQAPYLPVPPLSSVVPDYMGVEEDSLLYQSEVAVPATSGWLTPSAVELTTATFLVFGHAGLDTALELTRMIELQRREFSIFYPAVTLHVPGSVPTLTSPPELSVELKCSMERVFSAEDVHQMVLPIWRHKDLYPTIPREVQQQQTATGRAPRRRPGSISTYEEAAAAWGRAVGQACVCLLVLSKAPNPPILQNFRQTALGHCADNPNVLLVDVSRPLALEPVQQLGNLLFTKLPVDGSGFGKSM